MKTEMYKLSKTDVNIDEIENMKLQYLKTGKAIFILKLSNRIIESDISNGCDYFLLFEFLRKITPCQLNKKWIGKFGANRVDEEVQHVMNLIRIDRIAKEMNVIICFNKVTSILLDDYNDFGFNAMNIGIFKDNVKKAIVISQSRMVA